MQSRITSMLASYTSMKLNDEPKSVQEIFFFLKILNSLENKEQGSDAPRATDNLQDM
jgi:hypothetical protein